MSRTVARREATTFITLTYLLASGVAIALPHARINLMLSVLVPVIVVAGLIFARAPRGTRREAWGSIGLGTAGRSTWPIALLVPVGLAGAAYGTALVLGVADLRPVHTDQAPGFLLNLIISFVISTVFILGEEIGWRGYLLPRMQVLMSRRRAAVATGFAHGCFHLPLILVASTYDSDGPRWFAAPAAVVTIAAAGVFYAYLRDRSASLWPVAIAHNAANTVFDIGASAVVAGSATNLALVAGETGLATMGAAVMLAVLLLRRAEVWRESAAPATSTAGQARSASAVPVGT